MKAQSTWISEAHGKLGGSVFRSTRHGMVISSKSSPTVRRGGDVGSFAPSGYPDVLPSWRQFYAANSKAWQSITESERDAYLPLIPNGWQPWQWLIYVRYASALMGGGFPVLVNRPFLVSSLFSTSESIGYEEISLTMPYFEDSETTLLGILYLSSSRDKPERNGDLYYKVYADTPSPVGDAYVWEVNISNFENDFGSKLYMPAVFYLYSINTGQWRKVFDGFIAKP